MLAEAYHRGLLIYLFSGLQWGGGGRGTTSVGVSLLSLVCWPFKSVKWNWKCIACPALSLTVIPRKENN